MFPECRRALFRESHCAPSPCLGMLRHCWTMAHARAGGATQRQAMQGQGRPGARTPSRGPDLLPKPHGALIYCPSPATSAHQLLSTADVERSAAGARARGAGFCLPLAIFGGLFG